MQRFSHPDLFVEVSTGSSYAATSTKKNTADPVWDETLLLWPEAPSTGTTATSLSVRVFDADATGKQDLGCGEVDLGAGWSSLNHHPATVWRPLTLFSADQSMIAQRAVLETHLH